LLHHAYRLSGRLRQIWNTIAALSVGFGIWATHFITIMAFHLGSPLRYDFGLTLVSLIVTLAVCGGGIVMVMRGTRILHRFEGGAVLGSGIVAMHYLGVLAIVGDIIAWNGALIIASVVAGVLLAACSMVVASGAGPVRRVSGIVMLTLAIFVTHPVGRHAAVFTSDVASAAHGFEVGLFFAGVAFAAVVFLAAASILLDEAGRRRNSPERERAAFDAARLSELSTRRELAMAYMAQGLCLFGPDNRVRIYNDQLVGLLGLPEDMSLEEMPFLQLANLALIEGAATPLSEADASAVIEQHANMVRSGGDVVHTTHNGRSLRFTYTPIGDGSWLSTVDDITESKRSEAAIAHLARHDSLTGLPNRAMFNERFDAALEAAEAGDNNLAIIAIDLDRFKEVNDGYGHAAGDAVLQTLARRLGEGLREGEIVARLGGDEFAALKSFTSMEALREFLARLEAALYGQVLMDDTTLQTSGSIGVAIYPEDGADRARLFNNADMAMYRAKAEFGRRICYYEAEMDEHARQRREMAADLWASLEANAFQLVYQVQRSLADNLITGYEVLLRWERPGHGLVSPADFIPIAEECGAISPLNEWMLRQACAAAAAWPEPHKIAVNVSSLHYGKFDLAATVRAALTQSGLQPSRLELEVDERAIVLDNQRGTYILHQVRAMGVGVVIDSFGGKHSILDTLRSFPFDKIKLDRSFLAEITDNEQSVSLVRAILALGRGLSVPVLAEGVETPEQLAVLRAEGCSEVQGHLLGKPGQIDWTL
ncbi:MAG TPA: EAL domain-containing protein, partial [Devosia sp.]|nr:EAL domain-containing protein [Devosia sp.]